MWSKLIKSSPIHNRSYRDRNQQTFIAEHEQQLLLGRDGDLASDLSQHLDAFSPLPFNAPADAQRIWGPHLIDLADEKNP